MRNNTNPENWCSLSIRRNRSTYVSDSCVQHVFTVYPKNVSNSDTSVSKREKIGKNIESIVITHPSHIDIKLNNNSYYTENKSKNFKKISPKQESINMSGMIEKFQFSITVCGKLEDSEEDSQKVTVSLELDSSPVGSIKSGETADNIDAQELPTSFDIEKDLQDDKM